MTWGNKTRQERGYGREWSAVRKVVIARDKGLCQMCLKEGRLTIGRDVDHKIPKAKTKRLGWSQAQTDHPNQLWLLCKPCHDQKSKEEVGATYKKPVKYGADGWPIEG